MARGERGPRGLRGLQGPPGPPGSLGNNAELQAALHALSPSRAHHVRVGASRRPVLADDVGYPTFTPPCVAMLENAAKPMPRVLASLMAEAKVILPLRASDRYKDPTDSLWKTRNYGTLGGGAILGDGTTTTTPIQLPYTPGRKGLRSASLGAGDTGVLRLPYAWLDCTTEFTVLVRYQRPHNHINYAAYLFLGPLGAGSDNAKYTLRQHGADQTQVQISSVASGFQFDCVSPTVLVVTSTTATPGTSDTWADGVKVFTTPKAAGTPPGTIDHVIGGAYIGTDYYAYPNMNILDVVCWSRKLTDAEIAVVTAGYQSTETPLVDILAGQSNMLGPGTSAEGATLPDLSDCDGYFNDQSVGSLWGNGWGVPQPVATSSTAYYFGPELTIAAAKKGHYLVKYARNGSSIATWVGLDQATKVDLTDGLLRAMYDLAARPIFNSFVWLQGENDAQNEGQANAYGEYLTSLAAGVRYMTRKATLKLVIGRLSSQTQYATLGNAMPYWATVRAAVESFVAGDGGHSAWVDLDAFPLRTSDYTHFLSASILGVGTAVSVEIP